MKVDYNGKVIDFKPLLEIMSANAKEVLLVKAKDKKFKFDESFAAAIMFNILGFFLQMLDDSEQNDFIRDTIKNLNKMIKNDLHRFDSGLEIK